MTSNQSLLSQGNQALRDKQYQRAIDLYIQALQQTPDLGKIIAPNIERAKLSYRAERNSAAGQRVAVCGWELSHNAAGRVYTLAQLYQTFAEVEIIGSLFPKWGRELWEPIRNTTIPCHTFIVEDQNRFIEQALQLVLAHPYDIVHLSKPRAPNIFFGLLYKLIWDAKVLMDIDDEELAFVGADTPISIDDYLKEKGRLPELKALEGLEWTRLAVGLAKEFDGVTVSNPALQQRYGGEIIRHARDEKQFKPSPELKRRSRERFGIAQDKKVVLFFGTPREHKGLLETAEAIATLKRQDVLFVIVGDFPVAQSKLKEQLLAIKGVDYHFIGNQPFDSIPEVVAIGDVCMLLQDADSAVSQFQVPAKLSDALGMGVPVLSNSLPSLVEFFASEAIIDVKKFGIQNKLKLILYSEAARLKYSTATKSGFSSLASFSANTPALIALAKGRDFKEQDRYFDKFIENIQGGGTIKSLAIRNDHREIKTPQVDFSVHDGPVTSGNINNEWPYFHQNINLNPTDIDGILAAKLIDSPKREFESFDFVKETQFLDFLFQKKKDLVVNSSSVMVSIVMPTYNRGRVIEKAVASVLEQTHKKWELFIVDDGSTDDTIDILRNYKKDPRIKVLQGDHGGVSAARNKGLRQVSGRYVFYLDSDNTWLPRYLQVMTMALLYSQKKTGYSAISLLDDNDKVIGYRGEPFNWEHCLESNYVDLNAFAHHSELIKECGVFDESLRRMVDWDLILRYTKNHTPFYIPFIGCNYLQSKKDAIRITLSEPKLFQKVVRVKNTINSNSNIEIAKSLKLKIAIKIPAHFENRHEWGDFHYADSLRCAFEKMGHEVVLDFYGKWHDRPANEDDVIIVIRGLSSYKPVSGPINILWNISHPDQVSFDEYESYDCVFIASLSYASFLAQFLKTRVKPLLQCTDPTRFYYTNIHYSNNKLLFVGNSRNEYRPIVKMAIEAGQDIDIYGTRWQQFVPKKHLLGENIPNQELRTYYSDYGIVLNDHWESMRAYGFVSNRIFDVLASGGMLISDAIPSISHLFGNAVTQMADSETMESVMARIRSIKAITVDQRQIISEYICNNHSFENRAQKIYTSVLDRLGLFNTDKNDDEPVLFDKNQSQRKKVGLLLQNGPKNPTSSAFIRLTGPLTTEEAYVRLKIVLLDDVNDPELLDCASVIVQRVAVPDMESAEKLITIVRQNAIGLYVDNDDAFSALPETHPEFEKYKASDSILRLIMRNADHVWFSTPEIANLYRQDWLSASIVPNTLDPRLWRNYRRPQPQPALVARFRILYMGTATHDADFALVLPALDALFDLKGNCFEVIVIGAINTQPQREWLQIITPPAGKKLYPHFARWLLDSGQYDIGIAPLVVDHFNDCKSDIKFLDYTAIGIPTICSRGSAYQSVADLGLVLSCDNTTEQWLRSLTIAMENRELMLNMFKRSWEYLWGTRTTKLTALQLLSDLEKPHQLHQTQHSNLLHKVGKPERDVAVCLHLFYIERWEVIQPYLKNIPNNFDLYVTCQAEDQSTVMKLVHEAFPNAIIVATPNRGMDVLPFLQLNHDYGLWRYEAVLKLHSKNDKNEDGDTIGRLYLDSLLGSPSLVNAILNELYIESCTGMIGPEIMYRSAKSLMYGNKEITRHLIDQLKIQQKHDDWGFFAGTMFWIRGELLRILASKFTEISAYALECGTESSTGGDGTWAHAMERVFGCLQYYSNRGVAVTYICSPKGQHSQLRQVNPGELLKNPSFRNGSTAYLRRYKNLLPWSEMCRKSGLYDENFYAKETSCVLPLQMDPLVHYIMYGDCYSFSPSIKFSTSFYKKNNADIIKARIPCLAHYITNGKKEGRRIAPANSKILS